MSVLVDCAIRDDCPGFLVAPLEHLNVYSSYYGNLFQSFTLHYSMFNMHRIIFVGNQNRMVWELVEIHDIIYAPGAGGIGPPPPHPNGMVPSGWAGKPH